jgi:MFS family permease
MEGEGVLTPPGTDAARPVLWAPLAGVIAAVSVFAIAQGLTYPLLSFILGKQGHSAAAIGLSAAMTPIGFIVSAPLIPPVARRLGAVRTMLVSAALGAALLFLIGWTRDLWLWFPLRFLLGLVVLPLYVLSEVWIIALAPDRLRGRILGIYTSTISVGFAVGPLSLGLVGTEGWTPFLVGIGAFTACGVCMAAVGHRLPAMSEGAEGASVRSFMPKAPALLLAVFVVSAFEQAMLSLLPVYGTGHGIGEATMAALLTALTAGNIALPAPLGWAAERWKTRDALPLCAAGLALGCALLPIAIGTLLVWPLVFLLGGLSFGIYTLALVELGTRFSGAMMIAGNSAFALMWGIGGIAGPSTSGAVMTLFGAEGLPLTLAVLCLALVAVRFARTRTRKEV